MMTGIGSPQRRPRKASCLDSVGLTHRVRQTEREREREREIEREKDRERGGYLLYFGNTVMYYGHAKKAHFLF